jgi:hypothetical protein
MRPHGPKTQVRHEIFREEYVDFYYYRGILKCITRPSSVNNLSKTDKIPLPKTDRTRSMANHET